MQKIIESSEGQFFIKSDKSRIWQISFWACFGPCLPENLKLLPKKSLRSIWKLNASKTSCNKLKKFHQLIFLRKPYFGLLLLENFSIRSLGRPNFGQILQHFYKSFRRKIPYKRTFFHGFKNREASNTEC